MPISTDFGPTDWSAKEIAAACDIAPQKATIKLQRFERRVGAILAAAWAAHPTARPCDLAASLAAVVDTAAALAAYDRPRLERRLRQLAGQTAVRVPGNT